MSLAMRRRPTLVLLALLVALAFPAAAQALQLEIENQSGVPDSEVWVTVYTNKPPADFVVPGFENDKPRTLESFGSVLTIERLVAGRIIVSYGAPTTEPIDFHSQTRFDWIELTYTSEDANVANLTAVEQFGIGMRLNTYGVSDEPLEELGSANADTIFDALRGIPGGESATVRNSKGEILRVLSPLQSDAYPDLGEYVRSMAGKTIQLHSTFSGPASGNFATSSYSGTFAADGSIVLTGTYERNSSAPEATAPHEISMPGPELIEDIYTGGNTPNNLEGQIRHDVLVGFMAGYWNGRYGNDAIHFCGNAVETDPSFCPTGFNRPAFGAARSALSPFPTCEQYAAVINQYADMYGNPYSDGASGDVTVPIVKSHANKAVKTLKLTILPDSGGSNPDTGGNADCGASSSSGGGGGSAAAGGATPSGGSPAAARVGIHTRLFKHTRLLRHGRLRLARVACSAACGRVRAVVRRGKRVLARAFVKHAGRRRLVVARLTKPGRRMLRRHRKLRARFDLWVAPSGQRATHRRHGLLVLR
jgi:hypothetical protein